jgi:hypothetical protein
VNLGRTETGHTGDPAAGSLAGGLAETDIKGWGVAGVVAKGPTVFPVHLGPRQRLFGETKQASHD